MYLTRLSLTDFRSFSRLDVDLPRRMLLLVGMNAQGKTSLLEAMYYLATFSSFNTSYDRQLINFNAERGTVNVARIIAEFMKAGKSHKIEIRLIHENNRQNMNGYFRKEILLNGTRRRLSEVYGQFNAVLFLPQMARIIEGSPSDRRSYLDLTLSQVVRNYQKFLRDYEKTLSQRNALLKSLLERGGDTRQLEIWDDLLARAGAEIIKARIHAIKELYSIAKEIHHQMTDGKEVLRLSYKPSYDPLPRPRGQLALPVEYEIDMTGINLDDIRSGFQKSLHANYSKDIARGLTMIGPHRDELRFLSNQIDLGDFGSRGQSRTALLALKLAEVQWMHLKTGDWPVLLLDELMSELDTHRRADVIKMLSEVDQAFLTSTDLDMFPNGFVDNHEVWMVNQGSIKPF